MKKLSTQHMTRIAVLAALAAILFMIEIPVVSFYKLDLSNLPVLLGGFSMGTVPALLILAVKSLLGLLHSGTGGVGELADFIMGAAYVVPAALIYARHKNRKHAVIGMAVGSLTMILAAALVNYLLLFPMLTRSYPSWEFIITVTTPFNLLKGVVLSVTTYLVYKPLSPLLHVK